MVVIFALFPAIAARWDDGTHALPVRLLNDAVTVIALVRNQVLGLKTTDQACSFRAIRSGSRCDNDSERHTMRIHGQMYLGVEPPFVRPTP